MSHCVWEPGSSVQVSQEAAMKKAWSVGSWEWYHSRYHQQDQKKGNSMSTNRVFHGTSIRVETSYKKIFCKWRNASKKHALSRHRMREITMQKFLLCHPMILIIMKVATRLYIVFSFNPFKNPES